MSDNHHPSASADQLIKQAKQRDFESTSPRSVSYLAILLAIIYSTALNLSIPHNQDNIGLPSLPLRQSSLATLLPHIIFESILISRLSQSTFTSFGACLHLLKVPLLSTAYRYFKIEFKTQICRSITFDLINYFGQFLLFYFLSSINSTQTNLKTNTTKAKKKVIVPTAENSIQNDEHGSCQLNDSEEISYPNENEQMDLELITLQQESLRIKQPRKNLILMSILTWILVSLTDGLFNFIFEKTLSLKIQSDIEVFTKKLELDQFFLLKSSETIKPTEVLRSIPPEDRTMIFHQMISPLINLPFFFSSASLISLPSDFILLDRLPMLSIGTKLQWLTGLILRRLLNSGLAYFFKT